MPAFLLITNVEGRLLAAADVNENVRYEPNDRPPSLVALGAGAQAALITLAPIVLTVVIVVRIADGSDSYMSWAAFAALVVSGVTTVMQAVRVGRIGSGHILIMGTSGAFIAVCVAALVEAGPSTMASLVVISSLFQFLLAARLSLLRRIFTPVVSGTVIMLIAATVMPITRIGARSVGVVIGVLFFVLAFFPKVTVILIAIPGPVAGAYVTVLLGLLFVQGMKIVIRDGVDHRKAAVAGVSFWIGTGFQNQWIYPDLLGDGFLGVLLGNGMTSGAIVAIIMMLFMELTAPRRRRLQAQLDDETLP